MAHRLLMLFVQRQHCRVAVILIHNLSITLWLAVYDLSQCISYTVYCVPERERAFVNK